MRVQCMGRVIRAALKGDRRRRVETAGKYVERILNSDPPLPCDPLKFDSSRRRSMVHRCSVLPLHPPTCFTGEGRVTV